MSTVWSDNATAFATRAEGRGERVSDQRVRGVQRALDCLHANRAAAWRRQATYEALAESVLIQCRLDGLGLQVRTIGRES